MTPLGQRWVRIWPVDRLQRPVFALGSVREHRLIGFPFRECAVPPSARARLTTFPSRLGLSLVDSGLALVGTNYPSLDLELDTVLVSSGATPITLIPRGWKPPYRAPYRRVII